MRIVVATGIYPPDIGGPSEYAKEVVLALRRIGHKVSICRFSAFLAFPAGLRHFLYFFFVFVRSLGADCIFIPDTFSAAVPAVAVGKLLRKKTIIRTGGDFLWEWYVERTGDLVLLRNFYNTNYEQDTKVRTGIGKLNTKERFVFWLVGWALRNASAVVFSTAWQRDIFSAPYRLDLKKCFVVENCYNTPTPTVSSDVLENIRIKKKKVFVGGTRKLKWKNTERLRRAFAAAKARRPEIDLDVEVAPHKQFVEKIQQAYAVILVSLGDISPNTILDALRAGTPFVLTRECGILNRVGDYALLVDPENEQDIAKKILWLADEKNYVAQTAKVRSFSFYHSWEEIASEILGVSTRT